MNNLHITVCKYSGVELHASNILGRFISIPELVQHPIFEHRVSHVLRIAANPTLEPIERRVIVAALIKNLNLVEFDCTILPSDYTTSNLIAPLISIVNKIAALPEKELKRYPRYRITSDTRDLTTFKSYLDSLQHAYLWQTQGRVMPTIASQQMEDTFQSKLDDAAKQFNAKTVNTKILSWGFSFVRQYEGEKVLPRTIALMDLLEDNPTKSWKALYAQLNSRTRNLIAKFNMVELRELLYDLLPEDLDSTPRRIVVIRYIDALIEGQQKDLMNHLAELGETEISKNVIKTVSGVSYLVKEVNEKPQENKDKPKRSDYTSAADYAKAFVAYSKGLQS